MKRTMMALAVVGMLAGGAGVAQANGDKCPMCECRMDPGKKVDHMSTMLDLNDKQKSAVKDLMDAKMKKMKPAMDQMEATAKSAHEDFEAGLKKVLSDKQWKKYEAMREHDEDRK